MTPIRIGIVGCGNIAPAYLRAAQTFEVLELVACADLDSDRARLHAGETGCRAATVDELLADPAVDMVINLTPPAAHAEISLRALEAGKHVYCEKPLAIDATDARAVLAAAAGKGLRLGCAPDTFLGAGLQTCRKLIDDGWIGRVHSGTAFMMSIGPERWHPNPHFFYRRGAGPMFDMGPYYLTALVHLLGPIRSVSAVVGKARQHRIATCKECFGAELPVEVPTHYSGSLVFHSGALVTMTVSFDVHAHKHTPIEIYGTGGSLRVPDPNTFGGPVELFTPASDAWQAQAFSHGYSENMRSIGAADMAYAIDSGRPHRCGGALAGHVLDVMLAFEQASLSGERVTIDSRPEQPAPLPLGLVPGRLDP